MEYASKINSLSDEWIIDKKIYFFNFCKNFSDENLFFTQNFFEMISEKFSFFSYMKNYENKTEKIFVDYFSKDNFGIYLHNKIDYYNNVNFYKLFEEKFNFSFFPYFEFVDIKFICDYSLSGIVGEFSGLAGTYGKNSILSEEYYVKEKVEIIYPLWVKFFIQVKLFLKINFLSMIVRNFPTNT